MISDRDLAINKRHELIGLLNKTCGNVLYVDDEPNALNSFRAMFRREFNIFVASTKEEAISLVKSNNIDTAIVDFRLPKTNGIDIINSIKKIKPLISFALISAFPNDIQEIDLLVLNKPFDKSKINVFLES